MSRQVKRWVAECDFGQKNLKGERIDFACDWNRRTKPTLHASSAAAVREARDHAMAEGHIGAKEVTVERRYKLESEEIVG